MSKIQVLLLVVFSLFAANCARGPEEILLDDFEGPITPETVDFGAAQGSSLKVEAEQEIKVCGQQSLKLDYVLKPSGYMWVARGYGLDVEGASEWNLEPKAIPWRRYKTISLQMYGSNSGGVIAFDIKDSGGELWRFILDDDFTGWKEINCRFDLFFPRKDWQPDTAEKNETLDFPIMSFQFEPRLPGKGIYYFDCLKLKR
jgi:hypothetical protein